MRDDGGDGGGAGAGGSGSGGEGGGKRARKSQKKGALEINQENVVEALRIHGGRLASKVFCSVRVVGVEFGADTLGLLNAD